MLYLLLFPYLDAHVVKARSLGHGQSVDYKNSMEA